MTEVKVNPGICGFKSVVRAESEDMMNAVVTIESECPAVMNLAGKIEDPGCDERSIRSFRNRKGLL